MEMPAVIGGLLNSWHCICHTNSRPWARIASLKTGLGEYMNKVIAVVAVAFFAGGVCSQFIGAKFISPAYAASKVVAFKIRSAQQIADTCDFDKTVVVLINGEAVCVAK